MDGSNALSTTGIAFRRWEALEKRSREKVVTPENYLETPEIQKRLGNKKSDNSKS